jgi:hypothetical protein
MYLVKGMQNATRRKTAEHATGRSLTGRVEEVGNQLFLDTFFSSLDLFDHMHKSCINCCGTVRQNITEIPRDINNKTLKLKISDICARVRGNMTAVIWKDKQDVHIMTNMHRPSTESNFCDEHGKAKKLPLLKATIGTWATSTEERMANNS